MIHYMKGTKDKLVRGRTYTNPPVCWHIQIMDKPIIQLYYSFGNEKFISDPILFQLVKQFVSVEEKDREEFPIIDRLIELDCPEEFINLFR